MDVPLEISFHQVDPSEALEARIRERAAKLEKLYDRLVACRVTVAAPHRQHRTGNVYTVRIDMSVPGNELVVSREPHRPKETFRDPDPYTVLNAAFDAAERQLKDFKARQRGETKLHDEPLVGVVLELRPDEDFGFLRSAEGRELRFHRNSLLQGDFGALEAGDRVQYVEAMGTTGPEASKVWPAPVDRV